MIRLEKLEELKNEWKTARPEYDYFVPDGILNFNLYSIARPKILFLLKEPNADFCPIAPLPIDIIGYGPKGNSKTFWRIMRGYEYIISSIWENKRFDDSKVNEIKEQPNNNTAYVNIKKQCENKRVSHNKDLANYATRDKELLNQQINLIDPDVIYCGGTFNFYKLLSQDVVKVADHVYYSNDRIIIDYLHPAHRKGYGTFKALYNLLDNNELRKIIA